MSALRTQLVVVYLGSDLPRVLQGGPLPVGFGLSMRGLGFRLGGGAGAVFAVYLKPSSFGVQKEIRGEGGGWRQLSLGF